MNDTLHNLTIETLSYSAFVAKMNNLVLESIRVFNEEIDEEMKKSSLIGKDKKGESNLLTEEDES